MKLSKTKKILLMTLLAAVMALCLTFASIGTAFAASRTVTMTGSNFFYANDGAKIYSYRDIVSTESIEKKDSDGKGTGEYDYQDVAQDFTMFYMTDSDDNVTYRYNLAYHWFAAEEDEEKSSESCSDLGDYSEGVEGWFSMVIGFNPSFTQNPEYEEGSDADEFVCDNFETFTIAFQSQQYTKTEDSVTTNYITFVNNGKSGFDNGVYVIITDDEEETHKSAEDFEDEEGETLEGYTLLHTVNGSQKTGVNQNHMKAARITIEFTGYNEGEYSVKVSSDYDENYDLPGDETGTDDESEDVDVSGDESVNSEVVEGVFKNVGGTFSKRVNSTTAGVMPLTFSATFPSHTKESSSSDGGDGEDNEEESEAEDVNLPDECGMILFALNGQTFQYVDAEELSESFYKNGSTISSGTTVNDNAPPVLCLGSELSYLNYGEAISFDYTVVDVLASSPKSEIKYYVLTAEQYADENLEYNRVKDEEIEDDDDERTEDDLKKSPFTLTTDDNRYLIETDIPYLPDDIAAANKEASKEGGTGYTVECLAKVAVELTDITSSSGSNKTTTIMLDWYIEDTVKIHDGETFEGTEESREANFIKVVKDTKGLTYGYFTKDGEDSDDGTVKKYSYNDVITDGKDDGSYTYYYYYYDKELAEKYQEEVDELWMKEDQYLLNAGSSSYFYLPAYNGFLTDNIDAYENLSFSIYYEVDGENGSNTGLDYNALTISLGSEGVYTFTVYATDSSSNKMYYLLENEDNESGYELVEFEGSDIFDKMYEDDELHDMLPWFTFEVVYSGATIDDPDTPSTGFVGTTYTDISFTINGISSYYETEYRLYEFDTKKYMEETGLTYFSYDDFAENSAELFENADTRIYFTQILDYADLNENDEKYDEMSEYEWDSEALSFIPQNPDAFYLVRLVVTDTRENLGGKATSYLAIHVSAEASEFRGETDWARNNIVSIVLFCVAGAALIGIIVVFCIRPKDGGDIDEQLTKKTEKEKAKAEKRKAKK
ncbi:MAG: hypothetical protein LUD29_06440 [Clostridia bacterium]|nr:hypothetical protein [Clostridia bacterium]